MEQDRDRSTSENHTEQLSFLMRLEWIVKSNKLPHKGLIIEMWSKIEIDQLQTITWDNFDSFLTRIG